MEKKLINIFLILIFQKKEKLIDMMEKLKKLIMKILIN